MSIELRYKVYEELYNKYATDVDPDKIAEKVKYLANQGDQQAAIKSFYEKYTGKAPTAEQLIYVSKYADPKSIGGLIDTENANLKSQQEKKDKRVSTHRSLSPQLLVVVVQSRRHFGLSPGMPHFGDGRFTQASLSRHRQPHREPDCSAIMKTRNRL